MPTSSVTEYIANQPKSSQPVLKKIRAIIKRVVPKADELISYQIPAYKLDGEIVIFFSGWSEHYSLYPATGRMNEVLGEKIAPYKVSKGTLKFKLTDPIPERLIERIVKIRAGEALERLAAKAKKQTAPKGKRASK
jgi:uncharacterized protein YdhG (YjbR/CyaY superfamily)